jgi:hypothetical protein
MREITKNAIRAFLLGKNFKQSNTEIKYSKYNDVAVMYLFDNEIAFYSPTTKTLQITTAGWNTTTTRERLNGLPNVSVTQRKGKLYLNGKEWDGELITIGE